jgi:hypothetical protein
MKKIYAILILILMLMSLFSCKKEETGDPSCGKIEDIYITYRLPQGPTWTVRRKLEVVGSIDIQYIPDSIVALYNVGDRMCIPGTGIKVQR